mgnify:CR=1 FL=1
MTPLLKFISRVKLISRLRHCLNLCFLNRARHFRVDLTTWWVDGSAFCWSLPNNLDYISARGSHSTDLYQIISTKGSLSNDVNQVISAKRSLLIEHNHMISTKWSRPGGLYQMNFTKWAQPSELNQVISARLWISPKWALPSDETKTAVWGLALVSLFIGLFACVFVP